MSAHRSQRSARRAERTRDECSREKPSTQSRPHPRRAALPRPATLLRRALMLPTVVAGEIAVLLASPVLLGGAALVSIAVRSTRPVRSTALVIAYAAIELSVLGRLTRAEHDWDVLLHDVLATAYRAMCRILDVHVVVEDGSATHARLARSDGLVVLARHCGPGDSLFVAWLLAVEYGLRLAVVLKSPLRLEPSLDIAGDHLPLCFVRSGAGRGRLDVHETAAQLRRGDALLLFPEGGNFSWDRWRHAVASLSSRGAYAAARRARRRTHTLPPRAGGAAAALSAAPRADVLLLAHSGFADDGRGHPWWRLPMHRPLVVRTVLAPAASVPRDEEALAGWLDNAWAQVDTWVEGHADLENCGPSARAAPSPAGER